jgi:two-component system, cell cycle sensor histidine kinase and response regulator CckA
MTEQDSGSEAQRTAEACLRFVLTATDAGLWEIDFATGVLQCSEILESQYGLPIGSVDGTFETLVEGVHPEDRGAWRTTMSAATRSGGDFTLSHRSRWPDGSVRWLSMAGRIDVDEHGKPVRGIGVSVDVTAHRALQEQLQQGAKMQAIGQLAGGVAHDFNNLLTVISGFGELLVEQHAPDDPRQADLAEIGKAVASGAELTRQLLTFSRKEIIDPAPLNLTVMVGAIHSMLARLIAEDIRIVLNLDAELWLVKVDRAQLQQVVMNLAVNARDAMSTGGTLTIATANIEFKDAYRTTHGPLPAGHYVVLTLTDTGTGMTPDVQARMFERFFSTKEPGKGTGLGLAIVYDIVAQNGGGVCIDSAVSGGTSVRVYFPRTDAVATVMALDAATSFPPPRSRATVLVVDDADGLRELVGRLLAVQGYAVLVAANADEALQLFERHASIDVLLTDVVMPGASGPELARQLVERRPALRAIYMSGYTEETIIQRGGIFDPRISFLHKPFTSETLGRRMSEVLAG